MATKTKPEAKAEPKQLSVNREVKTPLTSAEKEELLKRISESHLIIEEQTEALKVHREEVKITVDEQDNIITTCLEKYRRGYNSRTVECIAKYDVGVVTFLDSHTGEIVEQRPITEEEQLQLNSNRTDAEQIIRQAREEEDTE